MRVSYMCPCGRSSSCLCERTARWPDCATGWHDRCTEPRCGCPCHAKRAAELRGTADVDCPYCGERHDEAVFAEQGCPSNEDQDGEP